MKLKAKILSFFVILIILSSFGATAITYKFDYKNKEDTAEFDELWAVFITHGDPASDNKNTKSIYDILIDQGWKDDNIFFLKESEATKDAILGVADFLNDKGVCINDLILFYFSIHGGYTEDVPPLDEPDNLDEYISAYNYEESDGKILDEELDLMFDNILTENIIIIFETCYSGGMIDGSKDVKKSGRIIITSTKADETSYGFFLKDSWVFPYYLIRGLKGKADKNSDGYVSVEEAFKYAEIRTIIRSTVYGFLLFVFHKSLFNQHPQIYDGWPSEEDNKEELKLIFLK